MTLEACVVHSDGEVVRDGCGLLHRESKAEIFSEQAKKHSIVKANSFEINVDYRNAIRLGWFWVYAAGDLENRNPLLSDIPERLRRFHRNDLSSY